MSGQLESPHFLRTGDTVQDLDGSRGRVVDGSALYAVVAWSDGRRQEIEQFDPQIIVIQRAEPV